MNNGAPLRLKDYGREIHCSRNGGKGPLLQRKLAIGITLQSLGENMVQKINYEKGEKKDV